MPEIRRVCEDDSKFGARCRSAYVDPSVSVEQIPVHREDYEIAYDAVCNSDHVLVESAGAGSSSDASGFDGVGHMNHRGRTDNLYAALEILRQQAIEQDFRDALGETLAGKPVSPPRTRAVGRLIPFQNREQWAFH